MRPCTRHIFVHENMTANVCFFWETIHDAPGSGGSIVVQVERIVGAPPIADVMAILYVFTTVNNDGFEQIMVPTHLYAWVRGDRHVDFDSFECACLWSRHLCLHHFEPAEADHHQATGANNMQCALARWRFAAMVACLVFRRWVHLVWRVLPLQYIKQGARCSVSRQC